MATVHHYMVDYEDDAGRVRFANANFLYSLNDAKALARYTSSKHGSAYVVAFTDKGDGTFAGVGHVCYCDGKPGNIEGQTA